MVIPLANRPVAPDGNAERALYVTVGAPTTAADPLRTTTTQQSLINFCGTNNITTIYIEPYTYLGGSNYTNARANTFAGFLEAAAKSGIVAHAWLGDTSWGQGNTQPWINGNIFENLNAFQSRVSSNPQRVFKGIQFDVEWWADPTDSTDAGNVPGLCSLMQTAQKVIVGVERIGCFGAFFLKDDTNTRPPITFNGVTAQAGAHLMDWADYTVIGSYRDTAAAQIALVQPWFNYASNPNSITKNILAGVETQNIAPTNITYWNEGKAYMNTQLPVLSSTFSSQTTAYLGAAIHTYDSYSTMPA